MRRIRSVVAMVVLMGVLGFGGCSAEEGFRQGVSDGVSAAMAALIQTPVNHALDQAFASDTDNGG